jgi:hypothetical protein
MLVGVPVIADIVVIIIGVGKEQIVLGKNKGTAHIDGRQIDLPGIFSFEYVFLFIG